MEIRELNADIELTSEEVEMLSANEVSVDELRSFLSTSGPQNLDVAIGGIKQAKVVEPVAEVLEPSVGEVVESSEVVSEDSSKLPEDASATS